MRITVSGWSRNEGEKEIMNAPLDMNTPLEEPETGVGYTWGKTYLRVKKFPQFRSAYVHVLTSTKLRLGGSYLLDVELDREEIARLFYETHGGDIVRMFRSFIEDEEKQHYARQVEKLAQYNGRRRRRLPKKSKGSEV